MTAIETAGTFARHQGQGFVRTIDGSAWLYWTLPSQPSVRDAGSWSDKLKAARPIQVILPALAALAPRVPLMGRKVAKSFYRHIHILAIATPQPYKPSDNLDTESRIRLQRIYANTPEHDRFTLVGVRLNSGGEKHQGFWSKVASWINQAETDEDGTGIPDEAFNTDRTRIQHIFQDAGCRPPTEHEMRRALAWWQTNRMPETVPIMVEHEHMHTFPNIQSCRLGEDLRNTRIDCTTWSKRIQGSYPMTIVSLGSLPFQGQDERNEPDADWAATLLASARGSGQGALALSIRGLVEPGEASREQIDKDKQNVLDKTLKQLEDNHKTNVSVANDLSEVDDIYQVNGRPWPTLIDAHVHVAIPDVIDQPNKVMYPGEVRLNPDRQEAAFQDMMIGSSISYNPSPVYWPTPILAFAGLSGRSVAGEDMGRVRKKVKGRSIPLPGALPGALLGFSESDRLPVYCSPFASRFLHCPPGLLVLSRTGGGKTRVMLHLASQWSLLRNPDNPSQGIPGVFFDPKPNSDDFEPFVHSQNGNIYRLDDPKSEALLDPLRCMPATMGEERVQTAVELLGQILGGEYGDRQLELALTSIIGYGIRHGADCTGIAVQLAYEAYENKATDYETISPKVATIYPELKRFALNQPMFRLIYGTKPGGMQLSISNGLTLISAGTMNIIGEGTQSVPNAVQRWVVRMAALGGAASIIGRNGYIAMDEAWSLLGDPYGVSVANRMGRLARAQHYMFMMASQKVDEFADAGLEDFVGRFIVLGMGSKNELAGRKSQAESVLMLTNQQHNDRMRERITHDQVTDTDSNTPDWDSLFALFDPDTGQLLRGSIGYYIGVDRSAIPVEINVSNTLV
ncbi:hypothetical protein [Bombiscardovia coagulans]|uniref:Phage protein n=1 Tax=Bombiscardovia coagulans TaxID=686666 RepID=A0A261ET78_9BIFI|nr:hypothetical protein [Bombiscardovia coagulans]OZG49866.1 phage protein [Bombiscardovia coagulans]